MKQWMRAFGVCGLVIGLMMAEAYGAELTPVFATGPVLDSVVQDGPLRAADREWKGLKSHERDYRAAPRLWGIVKGTPKRSKFQLYRAKGYDPYIYLGNYPFRGWAGVISTLPHGATRKGS